MTDERDDVIERVSAVLREPPVVDAGAKARLLVAVAAERERSTRVHRRTWPRVGLASAAVGLVAAGLLAVWFAWPTLRANRPDPRSVATTPISDDAPPVATLASDAADRAALRAVQLVFRDPAAHRVSVVGDFTDWDAHQAPMTRDSASGLWSVSIALRPGRHVYAFLVDDSIWVKDPRAKEAPDADFGRPGSVLLVGQP